MVASLDAYLTRSLVMEQALVVYIQDLAAGASEHLADGARGELARCLQARSLCRRMRDRPLAEIVLALCQAGLCDHAAVLVTGEWEAPQWPIT